MYQGLGCGKTWVYFYEPKRKCSNRVWARLAPVVKLNYAYSKVFFSLISLRAERKDNSGGKTMFGLFLLVRTSLLNQ